MKLDLAPYREVQECKQNSYNLLCYTPISILAACNCLPVDKVRQEVAPEIIQARAFTRAYFVAHLESVRLDGIQGFENAIQSIQDAHMLLGKHKICLL